MPRCNLFAGGILADSYRKRMRATVRDVARLAGVSPKTVSNVVNGQVPVSPLTRLKVEEALSELDYVPNLSARGLRNGRTGVIALALPSLRTAYSAEMEQFIVNAAAERGWSVQIEDTGTSDGAREAELLNRARAHLIDGLILNPVRLETSAVQRGVSLPPVVLIGEVDQPIADHVWIDNVAASRTLTRLLLDRGHRRIAALGVTHSASSRLRETGYRSALGQAGLSADPAFEICCESWDAEAGYQAVRRWLSDQGLVGRGSSDQGAAEAPCDAIFCFTDSLALGALHALAEAGLSVPDDVSVVGYDDVPEAAHYRPPLTTISFDKPAFAETVLSLLAARIAEPDRSITSRTVDFWLVERESVRSR